MAQPYRSVDHSSIAFEPIVKDSAARLFVVDIKDPVRIQTSPVVLTTSVEDETVPFVYLQGDEAMMTFFRSTETFIEDTCIANKADWFAVAKNLDDAVLRRGFKSFFGDHGFKVKIGTDVACFDQNRKPIGREDIPVNTSCRLILELSRLSFGKHEYGGMWKVVQIQTVPMECLIQTEQPEDDAQSLNSDIDEFI